MSFRCWFSIASANGVYLLHYAERLAFGLSHTERLLFKNQGSLCVAPPAPTAPTGRGVFAYVGRWVARVGGWSGVCVVVVVDPKPKNRIP